MRIVKKQLYGGKMMKYQVISRIFQEIGTLPWRSKSTMFRRPASFDEFLGSSNKNDFNEANCRYFGVI